MNEPSQPAPVGHPTLYTPELAAEICARLSEGESMRSVCRDESMPSARTLFNWMRVHPEFLQQYARAKEESADALSDEMIDIADDGTNDWMERKNADGQSVGWVANGEHIQRSRLRVETRKWIASKLKPKKYGDRLALGGADDMPPIQVSKVERSLVRPDTKDTDR